MTKNNNVVFYLENTNIGSLFSFLNGYYGTHLNTRVLSKNPLEYIKITSRNYHLSVCTLTFALYRL